MFTRRQIVTRGGAGALVAAIPASASAATPEDDNADVVRELRVFQQMVQRPLAAAFESNSLAFGQVPRLRELYTTFLKANNKFPDFCDVGISVFYDVYDWHVRNQQPLTIGRTPDNRLTIKFMFTTLMVRLDTDPFYFGTPID